MFSNSIGKRTIFHCVGEVLNCNRLLRSLTSLKKSTFSSRNVKTLRLNCMSWNLRTCKDVAKDSNMMATKRHFSFMSSRNVINYTSSFTHHTTVSPLPFVCDDLKIGQVFYTFLFVNDPIHYLTESIYKTNVCLNNGIVLNVTTNAPV